MPTPGILVLSKMLDRLLAGVMSGPNMNCRPARSRQRVDLTHLARLGDKSPVQVLNDLLGIEEKSKLLAKIKPPKKAAGHSTEPGASGESKETPYAAQAALLTKLRAIAEDARTYENDTGVAALNVGFPLLSVPPSPVGAGQRSGRRILAPIAFIPVTVVVKAGAKPSVEITCRGDGVDRVRPNEALLAWIEQQTGVAAPPEADATVDPWTEICGIVKHVADAMHLEVPADFLDATAAGAGYPRAQTPVEATPAEPPHAQNAAGSIGTANVRNVTETVPDEIERFDQGDATDPTPTQQSSEEPGTLRPTEDPALRNTSETGVFENELALVDAPRPDDDTAEPAIVVASVLGLFPTAHQGLIRDTRAMLDAPQSVGDGPIKPFLTTGVDFDAPAQPVDLTTVPPAVVPKGAALLAAAADPCQAAAVALARDSSALVIHGPPGTGKSQTITNIIADHLARGERVLLVCDKRTALDVVADRLDHLGLRQLCGIVHDPQRDQRDLYKSVKEQLDELAEATTDPTAETRLEKIDADLKAVHSELSAYFAAVSGKVDGVSFADLVGSWLASGGDQPVAAGEAIAAVSVVESNTHRAAMTDLFKRAEGVGFSRNPWARCAGISLTDFLTRPTAEWRALLDRLVAATMAADGTASPSIPAFDDKVPAQTQATGRAELAERLQAAWPRVERIESTGVWAVMAAPGSDKLDPGTSLAPDIKLVRSTPIEPAFAVRLSTPLTEAEIEQTRAVLTEYKRAAEKWTAMFAFKAKSTATTILQSYGLPLSVDAADRVLKLLAGVSARTRLTRHREKFLGKPAGPLASDQELIDFHDAVGDWVDLVFGALARPETRSAVEALLTRRFSPADFLQGLQLSSPRADAISVVHEQAVESRLFESDWLGNRWNELLAGKTIAEPARALADRLDSLEGVLRVITARASLPPAIAAVVDTLLGRVVSADQAMLLIERTATDAEIRRRLTAEPILLNVDDHRIGMLFDRFREMQNQRRDAVRDSIKHRWIGRQKDRLLNEAKTKRNSLATGLSGRLITRGEKATRLREVIARGATMSEPDPLFDLRPVWMASPETVAQIFPRAALFDVVVFDEASQCRLEEALPVLTRGKRVVVAGDPHQLPPTRFFESAVVQSDDEEPETDQEMFEQQQGQIEDLLAASLNLSIMQSYLDVHYRSRYADLIQFSNRHFYRQRLQPLPAHPSRRPAVSPVLMHRVPGVYQHRRNQIEADRVVEIVRSLLDQPEPPSIGIACLNLPQRDLIVDALDEAAVVDAEFGKKLAAARARRGTGSSDGLFVKNLENVQGDERDDIIISTTYGPDPAGKFHRRFGPVGMAGGGRRLNVLVTRARNRVHLVTSIPTSEYATLPPVPDGSAPTGAWLLFAYLQYADRLTAEFNAPASTVADSARTTPAVSVFVEQLATRLSPRMVVSLPGGDGDGFNPDLLVRANGAAVDLSTGVLCDVPKTPPATDVVEWDVFRTGLLTAAGWKTVRVWSPHFFRDPEGHLRKMETGVGDRK